MDSQQGFASLLSLLAFVQQPKSVVVPVEGGAGTKNAVRVKGEIQREGVSL